MEPVETLVVGAGPVGLFLAAELQRRGRSCIIVERASCASDHSKALAIMPGTMEIFARAGIAQAFTAAANRIDGVRFVTPRRRAFVPLAGIESAYNYVSILPQWKTQLLLETRLRELGGGVRYAHTLTALRQRPDGVDAYLDTPQGPQRIAARYLAGCDGVYSAVRDLAGIRFSGTTYPGKALLADAIIRTDVPANEARVHVHGNAVVTLFPMGETLRRVVIVSADEPLPECAERDWLQARLARAGYTDTAVERVTWSNAFRVHKRIANAMRAGNVFLAGDSAHTHSPVGGQGMNVGLHDAWNLAAALTAVLAGEAPETSLNSYGRERLRVAAGVLRRTDALTRALAHPSPLARASRERIAPFVAGLPMIYGPVMRRLSLTA